MVGAVDIGGTKIAVGLVDELGQIAAKDEFPTCVDRGFEFAMGRVAETLRTQIASTHCQMQGIGIGCTGPVDPISGVLGNVNLLLAGKEKTQSIACLGNSISSQLSRMMPMQSLSVKRCAESAKESSP